MSEDISGNTVPRIFEFDTNIGYVFLYCVKENQPPPAYYSLYYTPGPVYEVYRGI